MNVYTDHDREQLEEWLEAFCARADSGRVLTGKILDFIAAKAEEIADLRTALTAAAESRAAKLHEALNNIACGAACLPGYGIAEAAEEARNAILAKETTK